MLQRLAEIECVLRCGQTRSPWAIARADHQAELCRQPYTGRNFFLQYSDRVLFGTDLIPEPVYRFAFSVSGNRGPVS